MTTEAPRRGGTATAPPPTRRLRVGLVLGTLSLLVFLAALLLDLRRPEQAALGPSSFSRSGLGHAAFVRLLEERGVPVLVSRWRSEARAGADGLLVVAEPRLDGPGARGRSTWSSLFAEPRHVLVVLPKRRALRPSRLQRGWVGGTRLLPLAEVRRVLEPLELELRPRRDEPEEADARPGAGPEAPVRAPTRGWRSPRGWPAPELDDPQLIEHGRGVVPLLACEEGVLVGRLDLAGGPTVTLLTDPDLLAHHGLLRGRNAELALGVVEEARGGRRAVVWDETWHDFVTEPSAARLLAERPLGLLVAALALASALAVWAGAQRFGGARPLGGPAAGGKAFLVANTADLLRVAGHSAEALRRYAHAALREAERRLHLEGRPPEEVRAALAHAAASRSLPGPDGVAAWVEAAAARGRDARGLVQAGIRIHEWREELTDGRRLDP